MKVKVKVKGFYKAIESQASVIKIEGESGRAVDMLGGIFSAFSSNLGIRGGGGNRKEYEGGESSPYVLRHWSIRSSTPLEPLPKRGKCWGKINLQTQMDIAQQSKSHVSRFFPIFPFAPKVIFCCVVCSHVSLCTLTR